jgi:hypothetical protein
MTTNEDTSAEASRKETAMAFLRLAASGGARRFKATSRRASGITIPFSGATRSH